MASFSEVRTLIVADSPLARAGLSTLLDPSSGVLIVGGIGTESDLLDARRVYHPDVLVWDMGWDPMQLLERIAELRDAVCIIALSADVGTAVEAAPALLGAGVKGLLLQAVDGDALCAAVQAASQGMVIMDAAISGALHPQALVGTLVSNSLIDSLTGRELEVIRLIAEGLPNKSIAIRLAISEHTVKFHVNAILTKLGAQSRTEAVVRATRLGLITL